MKFFIDQEVVKKKELKDWAKGILETKKEEWLNDVAHTLMNYLDDSTEMMLPTSGSTGTPKIIRIPKRSMRLSAQKTGQKFGLEQGMNSLNCLPAKYIAGKMMIIRALELGLNQIFVAPRIKLNTDIEHDIDFAAMIPMQVNYLLDNHRAFLNKIKCLIIGGAPVSFQLKERLSLLDTRCFATYGMTETITHVAIAPLNKQAYPMIFEALPGIRFEEEDEQLVIHADHLDAVTIKTTDMVSIVDPYHFKWLGRADNVINSGGVKVFPERLEEKLGAIISQPFFVSSLPDDKTGQKVILLIEGQVYSDEKFKALRIHLNEFNSGERPRSIFFIPHFKRTQTGKIRRNLNLYEL